MLIGLLFDRRKNSSYGVRSRIFGSSVAALPLFLSNEPSLANITRRE
jgi:hypothetical protein